MGLLYDMAIEYQQSAPQKELTAAELQVQMQFEFWAQLDEMMSHEQTCAAAPGRRNYPIFS